MKTVVSLVVVAALLSGCSGVVSQYMNRPIYKDRLHEASENAKFMAIGGDYRIARVQLDSGLRREDGGDVPQTGYYWNGTEWVWVATPPRYDVCAETQADAIFTRSGDSNLGITDQIAGAAGSASTTDLLSFVDRAIQQATQTYSRTEVSDVVRHLGWQWCNARMNGEITATEYRDGLKSITENAFSALRANQRGTTPTNSTAPPQPPPPPLNAAGRNAGRQTVDGEEGGEASTKPPGN